VGEVYNAGWTETSLAPILEEVKPFLIEPVAMQQNFARTMSPEDALHPNVLLSYAVNGKALPPPNGFPLRLITPGWYGIANVKWLKQIEVRATRFIGRFPVKDYVIIREEVRNGDSV